MFRRIRICLLIAAYTLSYAGCSAEKSKAEELQSSYYSVVEYDLGEKIPYNSFLGEDRLVMCFSTYTEEYEEAYSEYMTDETLWETQAGPSDAQGNPIYPGNQLCVYDFEGNLLTDIDLGEELSPTLSSRSLVDNPTGGFCLLSTYTDFSSFEVTYQLAYFTKDGKLDKTLTLLPGEYISYISYVSEDLATEYLQDRYDETMVGDSGISRDMVFENRTGYDIIIATGTSEDDPVYDVLIRVDCVVIEAFTFSTEEAEMKRIDDFISAFGYDV